VAQHTQCANVDHHHLHEALPYEPDLNNPQVVSSLNQSMVRLGICEKIGEGFPGTSGGKSGYANGGFTHSIVPDDYHSTKERSHHHPSSDNRTFYKHGASGGGVCQRQKISISGTNSVGHSNNPSHQIISNVQLAQSHPHLFVNSSSGGYHGNKRESTNPSQSVGGNYSANPAISASYQNLPNQSSFYLHQQQERMNKSRQQAQSSGGPPDQQYLRVIFKLACSLPLLK